MNCQRCGFCCKSTFFALKDVPVNEDTQEIARWAMYHGVEIMKYPIDGVDYVAIKLPGQCVHLYVNDGAWKCRIYERRPNVCQDYFCQKARGHV